MTSKIGVLACMIAFAGGGTAAGAAAAATSSPVAYIYVASQYMGTYHSRVVGFAADSNGQLTPIPGSPWADNLYWMAVNGTYLFGSDNILSDDGRQIFSYRIESNGALQYLGDTNIQHHGQGNDCNQGGFLVVDHTDRHLYQFVSDAMCEGDETGTYESWGINADTGLLGYLGTSSTASQYIQPPMMVAADNLYTYAVGCNLGVENITGYKKQTNGNLVDLQLIAPFPTGQPPVQGVQQCLWYATPDPTNHFAVAVSWGVGPSYPDQIATYAIDTTDGTVSTNSTYSNMPSVDVQTIDWLSMSPSGNLLAVAGRTAAGTGGLQIFNFNPDGQATENTGLLVNQEIDMCYWDNDNHLYAISTESNQLFVFTVTPTSAAQAPGSPYSISSPAALVVQPE